MNTSRQETALNMTPILLGLLLSISSLTNRLAPAGTQLHIRLTSTVGSYASAPGSPISAVLIAPALVDGETILPAGSTLSGTLKAVTRVGLGIRHETAGLDLEFKQLILPDGESIPISSRVADVDNSREHVTRNGHIHGVRSTGSLCYRVSGYIRTMLQWEIHAELAEWVIRSLVVQLPEPEIYYPAGVELTLTLTEPVLVTSPVSLGQTARQLTDAERADLGPLIAAIPYRTYTPSSGRSSDLTNVLVIGSHDQIVTAFAAAGWTQANAASFRRRVKWLRAVAERGSYRAGPMSPLLLDGSGPDMAWEKGLNDVSKRHHVRMWKAGIWHGQELWIGAATRDIDFGYLRPGQTFTHRIEENIDQERDKIAYDLAFTSCANVLDWSGRRDLPRATRNATGDPITTDTRVAVIGLDDCPAPRLSTETVDLTPVPPYGRKLQRFARREILSARNELIRTNRFWRAYEGGRWVVALVRRRWRQESAAASILRESRAAGVRQSASFVVQN
jgi:LssY-like putative type I secretion system component LssY